MTGFVYITVIIFQDLIWALHYIADIQLRCPCPWPIPTLIFSNYIGNNCVMHGKFCWEAPDLVSCPKRENLADWNLSSTELESGNAIVAFLQTAAPVLDKMSGHMGARFLSSTGLGSGNLIGQAHFPPAPALNKKSISHYILFTTNIFRPNNFVLHYIILTATLKLHLFLFSLHYITFSRSKLILRYITLWLHKIVFRI